MRSFTRFFALVLGLLTSGQAMVCQCATSATGAGEKSRPCHKAPDGPRKDCCAQYPQVIAPASASADGRVQSFPVATLAPILFVRDSGKRRLVARAAFSPADSPPLFLSIPLRI